MTDAKRGTLYRAFAEPLLCKLGAALLFAMMLAMVTNAGLVQGLRFISAICFVDFVLAFRRRVSSATSFEWPVGVGRGHDL